MTKFHIPVLKKEVTIFLQPLPGKIIVDCTVGGGGHARELLKNLKPEGKLIAIDKDKEAIIEAKERLCDFADSTIFINEDFRNVEEILQKLCIKEVDGILFDLGVSRYQITKAERGFSFSYPGPLDMRMDVRKRLKASEIVNRWTKDKLIKILKEYGEEPWAEKIAAKIIAYRKKEKITTTEQLANLIMEAIPRKRWPAKIHPATRTFQALRIAVNDEMEALNEGLKSAINCLKAKGRICIISYHSLEDRMVKNTFKKFEHEMHCLRILTKKPVLPTQKEIQQNPGARSAKLRAAEKQGGKNNC